MLSAAAKYVGGLLGRLIHSGSFCSMTEEQQTTGKTAKDMGSSDGQLKKIFFFISPDRN